MNEPTNSPEEVKSSIQGDAPVTLDAPSYPKTAGISLILAGLLSLGLTSGDPSNPSLYPSRYDAVHDSRHVVVFGQPGLWTDVGGQRNHGPQVGGHLGLVDYLAVPRSGGALECGHYVFYRPVYPLGQPRPAHNRTECRRRYPLREAET